MEISERSVGLAFLAVGILMLSAYGVTAFDYWTIGYQYQHAIGAQVLNAYDAPNFEVMKTQLTGAYNGMRTQGLTDTDCARAWLQEQTQDWCMTYQYQYLQGLINRTDFYLARVNSGNISQFSDVYEQMINNMRGEMNRNGAIDWVAKDAWLLKYHSMYYWRTYSVLPLLGVPLLLTGIGLLVVHAKNQKYDSLGDPIGALSRSVHLGRRSR